MEFGVLSFCALIMLASLTPSEALTKAVVTKAIHDVLEGVAKSKCCLLKEHHMKGSSMASYDILGDIIFNGTWVEGIEDMSLDGDIETEDTETSQRITGTLRVPHYIVTGKVLVNFSYPTPNGGRTTGDATWDVESIADADSDILFKTIYFPKFNRMSSVELTYKGRVPEMVTKLKYPHRKEVRELGEALEPFVIKYYARAPTMLLSWLSAHFQNVKLD